MATRVSDTLVSGTVFTKRRISREHCLSIYSRARRRGARSLAVFLAQFQASMSWLLEYKTLPDPDP